MYRSINDIRKEFVIFFQKQGHQLIESSSLVPENDQTLLFTNSGMNQFKNIFLGIENPVFKRVVTVQRCMRAGGKHNDLDNVGYTDRHLTFFEMLGNFSFGDYFKHETIQFAWELLTDSNWFNLSKDRIWVTTHICDNESYDIWSNYIGISKKRVIKIGNKKNNFCNSDNFWQMGNFGPCGPCSEIFFDRGSNFSGNPPGTDSFCGERYLEIWNLVFIQFNRQSNGHLTSLPMLSVDTGMGLERIASVLQGVHNNYLIDIFKNLILAICKIIHIKDCNENRSIYVIADHVRSSVFLIKDGIVPANEGRGYVLRRIIRRAVLHGKKLGVKGIFLYKLVMPVITYMRCISDTLYDQKDLIEQILFNEEKLFENTLQKGLELLDYELMRLEKNKILSGKVVFRLYTTYGFPLELTKDICHERNIRINQSEFDRIMLKEKEYSKISNKFHVIYKNVFPSNIVSTFIGYDNLSYKSEIIALLFDKKLVDMITYSNKESVVILNMTPFYGESGGQVGDIGYLKTESAVFKVTNTKKYGEIIIHIGIMVNIGSVIKVGDQVYAEIDVLRRKNISLNHTATHLLHAALLKVVGLHAMQRGSLIDDRHLRFDFMHYKPMTAIQINEVEDIVNQQIWNNLPVITNIISIEAARKINAIMLSCKVYTQKVRALKIGKFSVELCGGTHAVCTGELGLFMIIREFSIGSGTRRIEAVTKNEALLLVQQRKMLIENIAEVMQSNVMNLKNKIYEFKSHCTDLEKEVKILQNKQELQKSLSLIKDSFYIKDVPILIKVIDDIKSYSLFKIIGHLKCHFVSGIIVLIHSIKSSKKFHVIVSIGKDLAKYNRVNALELVHCLVENFGGKGGGKSDFAQVNICDVMEESLVITTIDKWLNTIL